MDISWWRSPEPSLRAKKDVFRISSYTFLISPQEYWSFQTLFDMLTHLLWNFMKSAVTKETWVVYQNRRVKHSNLFLQDICILICLHFSHKFSSKFCYSLYPLLSHFRLTLEIWTWVLIYQKGREMTFKVLYNLTILLRLACTILGLVSDKFQLSTDHRRIFPA